MANSTNGSGLWRPLALSAVGVIVGAAASTGFFSFQVAQVAKDVQLNATSGAVMEERVEHIEDDLQDLEVLLRDAVEEMRRFHTR